ncbi:MAG: Rne/Rng family ribonuclease [Calditrichaeota bacterium]|nr:Rne/Rng family ribonuclease [Calditrichota bacterium]
MKQDIIINSTTSETRIALLEDDQLVELFVERPDNERMVGSLYKGVIRKVMVGMSAAFVDIGLAQDAFLHFSDIGGGNELIKLSHEPDVEQSEEDMDGTRRRWEGQDLKVSQEVLVQIIKEPIGRKGPRVSTQIALPGRFIVLVPNESFIGVSRKVTQFREKRRLRQIAGRMRPKGFGLIVRTLAEAKTDEELRADLDRIIKSWRKMESAVRNLKGAGLVYRDLTMASSIIRDLFTPEVNSLVVDSRKLHREISDYIADVQPGLKEKVQLYSDRLPIFDKYDIESEIEKCLSRKIWIGGGSYIYFDQTEALVAIDVNSGRFVGKRDHEENSLKVNLKAAKEISRQMRLRDIGGIIVIDFIDMSEEKNRKKVFDEMRRAMRMDRAKWDLAPIGPFGLMEMTRQRIRPALVYSLREPCPTCNGSGLVSSVETVVTTLERWIKRYASQTREHRLSLTVHPRIKSYLTGGLTSRLNRIMWANRVFISMEIEESLKIDEFKAWSPRQKRDITTDFAVTIQQGEAPANGRA